MPTLREGWAMPPPPVEGAVPTIYNDGGEVWLHWTHGGDEFLPVEGVSIDIPWPFHEDYARHEDLEQLGFVNADP